MGRKTSTAKAVLSSRTGRKATAKGAKGAFRVGRSDAGQAAGKAGARGAAKIARGAAKAKVGKASAKGLAKAGRGAGKHAAKRSRKEIRAAEKNLGSGSSASSKLFKFGIIVIAGLSIGAIIGRLMSEQESGQGGSSGGVGGGASEADLPRAHSDPSSGPLVGTDHEPDIEGVTEDQPELEQRIRTSLGEDERTKDLEGVNVEVNDGVAELRGVASSEEAKEAAGEIAAEVEGVSEVRNLIEAGS